MIFAWLFAAAYAAPCESGDVAAEVEAAKQAVLGADLAGAQQRLDSAEAALGCSAVDAQTLGKLWYVEGALLVFSGDPASAADSFAAAARVAPDVAIPEFGPDVDAARAAAVVPTGTSQIGLSPELSSPWLIWIDGVAVSTPATVVPGLHAVQAGTAKRPYYGKIILVSEGQTASVTHGLPLKPSDLVESNTGGKKLALKSSLWFATGGEFAAGKEYEAALVEVDGDGVEHWYQQPNPQWSVPIEVGATVRTGRAWARVAATVGLAIPGQCTISEPATPGAETSCNSGYVYSVLESKENINTTDDDIYSYHVFQTAIGGYAAVGATFGHFDFGASLGGSWPSRMPIRILAGVQLGDLPVRIEARGGINVLGGDNITPEGSFGLLAAFTPSL